MKKFLLSIFAVMLAVFSVQAQSYVKVTSAPSDWSGDYLIVYEAGNVAFNGALTTLDATSNTISVSISNGEIEANDKTNSAKFTIDSNGIIRSASGYSIGQTSNANGLKASTSTNYTNTITFNNDGSANIVSGGAYLRYNSDSNQTRFRYYKSSTYTGQKVIALYKYTEGGSTEPEQPEIPVETVANPVISPYGVTFNEGETLKVTIETTTEGADIYYTLDGTVPSADNGELYEGEIEITETTTVKAIAVKEGFNSSEVVEATYTKVVLPDAGEATEVTGNATVNYGTATINTIEKFEVAPVTLTFAKNDGQTQPAYNKAGDCRIYAKGSITATCSAGILTKIVFTISAQGKKRITDLTPSTGTVTIADDHSTVTWEGNASEVVLTVGDTSFGTENGKAGQICFTEFTATYVIPSYTLNVTDAGYATLFLDFPATIPAFEGKDAGAYIVTGVKDGNWLNLEKVEGVLPANTGIIVKANEGEYTFAYSTDEAADVTENLLKGTIATTSVEGEAYVLGYAEGTTEVVFGKAKMNGTSWVNNAYKAYLPVSALPAGANAAYYSFRFPGTTSIEEVVTENVEVKAIFDLTGRRVEEITAPGIYIVNGKKVLVK